MALMKKFFTPVRIMYIFSFFVLIIATVMNLTSRYKFISIIPYTAYVEAVLNSLCAILCIAICIKPDFYPLQYFVLIIESSCTTLIGFAGIGTMIFMFFVLTLFTNGSFTKNPRPKIIAIIIWWSLIIVGVFPAFGIKGGLFALFLTLLYIGMYLAIYDKLKSKLTYLLPKKEVVDSNINLPEYGKELNLTEYGLSNRQIKFLLDCINDGKTYEEIAKENNISVSVVKKEMAFCCKTFGVKNREALIILLLQYKIVK